MLTHHELRFRPVGITPRPFLKKHGQSTWHYAYFNKIIAGHWGLSFVLLREVLNRDTAPSSFCQPEDFVPDHEIHQSHTDALIYHVTGAKPAVDVLDVRL